VIHRLSGVGSEASARVTDGTSRSGPSRPALSRVHGKAPVIIERTGPAVRAALLAYSSAEECAQFVAELRSTLVRAAEDLDLSGPLGGWCFSRGGDPVERTALE
jgi:hypothetical protein